MEKKKTVVQRLRDVYGLTQEHLAIFLGVSRSMMGMMETGDRNWRTGTTLKQIAMEPIMLPPISNDLQAQIDATQQGELAKRKKEKQYEVFRKQQALRNQQAKLDNYKTKEQQAISALRLVEKVKTDWPEPDPRRRKVHESLWENVGAMAWIKLREFGQAAQADIQDRIDALQAEIDKWEKL